MKVVSLVLVECDQVVLPERGVSSPGVVAR